LLLVIDGIDNRIRLNIRSLLALPLEKPRKQLTLRRRENRNR
jgi:hypothetical protein